MTSRCTHAAHAQGDKRLAIPHLSVSDISVVNWERLKQAGFKAVVFDKDNTLTKPFEMQVRAAPRVLCSTGTGAPPGSAGTSVHLLRTRRGRRWSPGCRRRWSSASRSLAHRG